VNRAKRFKREEFEKRRLEHRKNWEKRKFKRFKEGRPSGGRSKRKNRSRAEDFLRGN